MSTAIARATVMASVLWVLAVGGYGVMHRVKGPALAGELGMFGFVALLFLSPYALLARRIRSQPSGLAVAGICVVMALIDSWLLGRDAFSGDPSWGFSILSVAVTNTMIFLVSAAVLR